MLTDQGLAVIELGQGQAAEVSALAAVGGLHPAALHPDLGGIDRALVLRRHAKEGVGKPPRPV
jgi:release factor glutamine methyltransferase